MLPGKTFTPEDVLRILRRRFWVIAVPFAVISAATAVVARHLPNRYRSEALILVVPQQVPEAYVRSTVTTRLEDRLDNIQQQILSRTRLERVIDEFNLYAEQRKTGIMEDIVERMRTRDMRVQVVKGDSFRVSYEGEDPRLIARVTDRLASLFIDESLKDRAALTENTSQFLESTLEDARRRLIEQEKKLEAYRMKYAGQLPTQVDSNLQALQNTSLQIQATLDAINRAHDQRLLLERQLEDLSDDSLPVPQAPGQPATPAQLLAAQRNQLAVLQQRGFTDAHPDVQITKRRIQELEERIARDELATPVSPGMADTTPADVLKRRRIEGVKEQVALLDTQIAEKEAEEKHLREVAASYQQKIDAVPARESEMVELMRDYDTLNTLYKNLLAKKEESKIAANLERRQIGEQFQMLDPARVPERPVSPNRKQINAFGMLVGLGLGLASVVFLEYRDTSFRTDSELTRVLGLPVLAVVPFMRSGEEKRRATRRAIALNLSLSSVVGACLGVLLYTFVR